MTDVIQARPLTPEIVQLAPRHAAVVRVAGASGELPALLGEAFGLTMAQVGASGGQVAGPPFARYLAFGERIEAEVGFPYVGTLQPTDRVHDAELPGGRAVMATYVGPYEGIGDAWEQVRGWLRAERLVEAGPPWESYLTGPEEPGAPVTQIVFPVR
ncbi:MAG TPA: GyrI-like domain-containing protein [Candidatus Limnocylindrales bacterium]|nr:GyrI-like domain-containing protein [Candidatus Limnocylindrales bacterium]